MKLMLFWSFDFPDFFLSYRKYFNLNLYIGKKVQEFFFIALKISYFGGVKKNENKSR